MKIFFLFLLSGCLSWSAELSFKDQKIIAEQLMFQNISPADGARGVVLASPSKSDPDYYFHWTRDAALVMESVVQLYSQSSGEKKLEYEKRLMEYLDFSRQTQLARTLTGLGEPRFYVDGRGYDGEWSRPQHDGPALRVLTLLHWADLAGSENSPMDPLKSLYTVVQTDLEFLKTHWMETSFDVWEEVKGLNFNTLIIQRAAFLAAAKMSSGFQDEVQSKEYLHLAAQVSAKLELFWNVNWGYLISTLEQDGGLHDKLSNLDTSVILGVLHAKNETGEFSVLDSRILATAGMLEKTFEEIYPLNRNASVPLIGRHREDRYYGGNPWFLTTFGFAEFHYVLARQLALGNSLVVDARNINYLQKITGLELRIGEDLLQYPEAIPLIRHRGDLFIRDALLYAKEGGHMSEQIERTSGVQISARDLTWSYSSLLTALFQRDRE